MEPVAPSPNPPVVEILSQGEEVVAGQVVDTNAAWLAQALSGLGFDVTRHTVVGDRLTSLVGLMREIAERADVCICTGGLGPTVDDLTAEATADAFGMPLVLDESALTAIRHWYERHGKSMPESNRKQALLPAGSCRLDNHWGTASGFALSVGRCRFYCLPGVPWEMRGMFDESVRPDVLARFDFPPPRQIVLRTVGVGESVLQGRVDQVTLPSAVGLGFCVLDGEVQVKLRLPCGVADDDVMSLVTEVRAALGDAVFAVDGMGEPEGSLAEVTGRLLADSHLWLALAETVSAGYLAQQCAALERLLEARVYRSGEALCLGLGVPVHGERCGLVAEAAGRLRVLTGADLAMVQLAFGIDGSELHIGLVTPDKTIARVFPLRLEPNRRRYMAAAYALDLLRRHLSAP